jgi:chromosome segregation ATPase
LESELEEQSSEADNAISEWHGRSSELEKQLETLTNEKEELLNAERSSSTLAFEELRLEKDRLEQELQGRDEALAAAREDLNQDAEVVHEWEGKLLEDCTWFFMVRRHGDSIWCLPLPFLVTDQVAELESTIQSLESQLEEQSSEADNAISQWQESYTTLEVRKSELETQLETLTKEKEELFNTQSSSNGLEVEELRLEKERLEQELQGRDEALAAAREDLNQDAEVVHEWEGKLLECWPFLICR